MNEVLCYGIVLIPPKKNGFLCLFSNNDKKTETKIRNVIESIWALHTNKYNAMVDASNAGTYRAQLSC